MKNLLILSLILSCTLSYSQKDEFPILRGPYLGQTPPGLEPEIFAPGIISTEEEYEINSIFSLDGKEFYYVISTTTQEEKDQGKYFYKLMMTKMIDGIWTKPEQAPFMKENSVVDITLSPDGNRLYFCSDYPAPKYESGPLDIWYVERIKDGWSEPVKLDPPINSEGGETQPSFTKDWTIYFPSWRTEDDDVEIYYSKLENGEYKEIHKVSDSVNTHHNEGNSYVSPDESFLIFARWGMPDSIDGGKGMYISFKKEDGTWTQAKNTRPTTTLYGSLATLSPDGKYLFYSGSKDIYWVDVRVLDKLKPDYLK